MSKSDWGMSSNVAELRRVLMRRPGAILSADPQRWHYGRTLEPVKLADQHEHFAELVAASGVEIDWLPEDDSDDLADSVFTYDPSFMLPSGAVVLRPGKAVRVDEADLHARFYEQAGIKVLGTIDDPGRVEGGDMFWLDDETIAVGRGFRTNQVGIEQMASIAADDGVALEVFDLPYFHGPEACLHLLSIISPLDKNLALIHAPLLPTALFEALTDRGIELLHAPTDEFDANGGMNLNVLATGPRRCIAVDGFPKTVQLMREAGCHVDTFNGDELCIPCEGGPTCLTRPLWRVAD